MSNYPEYVPEDFIRYFEFEFIRKEEKAAASKMIFDDRMAFVWSALSKRANECTIPFFFYQSLVMHIVEISKGPSEWDLLTQKEKESKVSRIAKLSRMLSEEIDGTPLDDALTEYFNHKFYIEWFKSHNKDEISINRMNHYLDEFCKKTERGYIRGDNLGIGVSSAWNAVGVNGPHISSMLIDLHVNAIEFETSSIIKRKVNPKKSFFVRQLSAFFEELFNLKLYELTANLSSLFLDEEVTLEEVKSITK
ncbi:hypothetical protein QZQ41_22765 [Serratia marcescens]|uniref:hypothetical protein n=1 Tax=Serratia marcescens TaxID=615 RepID=UPI001F1552B3|nr:hypothetical protein [Serratia marcescens]MDP8612276.1 hypothetical protein [Serratia marcescens]MDP8617369.1 hypothetical protein [Serratia marcescens]MDP8647574.1 hypothetical protein [Serratia marcescens]MDP8657404.1 hypothetical protein [Serratia marcescens]MDP8662415.1 hypothetical protein [Serratia marcescens]